MPLLVGESIIRRHDMFLALIIAAALAGGAITLGLILRLQYEQKERKYQEDRAEMYRHQATSQYDVAQGLRNDLDSATRRGDFWKEDYETLRTAFVEVDDDLQNARATAAAAVEAVKTAGKAVDFLAERVTELVGEVGELEREVEELEEESDEFAESANEALAGWEQADEIANRALAWGERVLNTLDKATGEHL